MRILRLSATIATLKKSNIFINNNKLKYFSKVTGNTDYKFNLIEEFNSSSLFYQKYRLRMPFQKTFQPNGIVAVILVVVLQLGYFLCTFGKIIEYRQLLSGKI